MAEALESELLNRAGFRHAFFTRRGGVSEGPFASLNFAVHVGDVVERVAENVARAAAHLGVEPRRIVFLSQVHGRRAIFADEHAERDGFVNREGDIVLAEAPTLACAVRSADCVPILIADRASGAVAAVHAGWRGVAANAVGAAVEALAERLGPERDLIAAVGPHISQDHFEVSPEVAANLATAAEGAEAAVDLSRERPHVDLRRIVHSQLRSAGLDASRIDDVHGCTVGDPLRFFSFRRDGRRSGRHLSAIVPRCAANCGKRPRDS